MTITAYKAFNADWTCRDFQYEVGQTYKMDGGAAICERGFHACMNPLDCFSFYPPTGKLALVEYPEATDPDADTKVCGVKIHIKAELSLPEFIGRGVDYILAKVDWSASTNTGDWSASTNIGYQSAASVEGASSHAIATGIGSKAAAADGSAIYIAEYDESGALIAVWAGIVGKDGIKPNTFYTLKNGKPEEVA